jgi:hypothetical protein
VKPFTFGPLRTLQDVIRALGDVEKQSKETEFYMQDADPGAVGARKAWLHSDGTLKYRNATNDGWITVS